MTARSTQSVLFSVFVVFGALFFGIGLFLAWLDEELALLRIPLSSMIVAALSMLILSRVRRRPDTKDGHQAAPADDVLRPR